MARRRKKGNRKAANRPRRDNRQQPEPRPADPLLPCPVWKRAFWNTIFNAGRNNWPRFLLKVAGAQDVPHLRERLEHVQERLEAAEEVSWSKARAFIIEFLDVVDQAPIDTEFFETIPGLLELGACPIASPDGEGVAWLSFGLGFKSPDGNPVYSVEEMRVGIAESNAHQRLIHQFKLTGQRLIQDAEVN